MFNLFKSPKNVEFKGLNGSVTTCLCTSFEDAVNGHVSDIHPAFLKTLIEIKPTKESKVTRADARYLEIINTQLSELHIASKTSCSFPDRGMIPTKVYDAIVLG